MYIGYRAEFFSGPSSQGAITSIFPMMLGSKSPRSARAWTALLQHASEIPHQQKKTATQEAMNAQNDALLSSWWLNQPIWKILVNLDHFPKDRGENEKCLKPPPSYIYQAMVGWFTLVLYCSRSYHPFSYCYHPFPYWGSLGFVSHRQKPATTAWVIYQCLILYETII